MKKFVDLFCGMGTIRMGFEQAGWECVYSVEWDKHKRRIYEVIFGEQPQGQDIRTVRGVDIPRADCWCFGAPCQDFSIAGKREGLEGDRSSMVKEVFRLIREIEEGYRPRWLLYENVAGMLSSNCGFDFLEILAEMESVGYDRIEYNILNSKDFGVPQNRERVFTLGHLRGRSTKKIFPFGGSSNETNIEIIGSTAPDFRTIGQRDNVYSSEGIMGCLSATDYKQPKQIMIAGKLDMPGRHESACRVYNPDGIAPCQNTCGGGGLETKIIVKACLTPNRLDKRQNGRRFKEDGEPMFTLTKQDIHGVMITNNNEVKCLNSKDEKGKQPPQQDRVYDTSGLMTALQAEQGGRFNIKECEATKKGYAEAHEGDSINLAVPGSKTRRGRVGVGVANTLDTSCNQGTLSQGRIRRLTPRECMRLQGVSDEVTDKLIAAGISDTQMYRAAGDATTVNVLYEIAKRLIPDMEVEE